MAAESYSMGRRSAIRSTFSAWIDAFSPRGANAHADAAMGEAMKQALTLLANARSIDDVAKRVLRTVREITGADKAAIVLCDQSDRTLDFDSLAVAGMREWLPQTLWEAAFASSAQRVVATGMSFTDAESCPGIVLTTIPAATEAGPIGALCIMRAEGTPAKVSTEWVSDMLPCFVGYAIESAQMAEEHTHVLLAGERSRIAREMHDGVIQSLFSISLGLELCKKQLGRDPYAATERLDELQAQLNDSMTELRRMVYDLRPSHLSERGLVGAIEAWIQGLSADDVVFSIDVFGHVGALPSPHEACLYRVAKEAVSNSVRHGQPSRVIVRLYFDDRSTRLEIEDDGCGFDVDDAVVQESGIGLGSMRHRLDRLSGTLNVTSTPGYGTLVRAEL